MTPLRCLVLDALCSTPLRRYASRCPKQCTAAVRCAHRRCQAPETEAERLLTRNFAHKDSRAETSTCSNVALPKLNPHLLTQKIIASAPTTHASNHSPLHPPIPTPRHRYPTSASCSLVEQIVVPTRTLAYDSSSAGRPCSTILHEYIHPSIHSSVHPLSIRPFLHPSIPHPTTTLNPNPTCLKHASHRDPIVLGSSLHPSTICPSIHHLLIHPSATSLSNLTTIQR